MRSVRPSVGWATLDCFRTQVDYSDFGFLGGLRRLDVSARASKIGVGYPTERERGDAVRSARPSARDDIYSDTLNYYVGATLRQSSLFGVRAVPTVTLYSELRSEYQVFRRYTPIGAILSLNQQLRGARRRDVRVPARVRPNDRGARDLLRRDRRVRRERAGVPASARSASRRPASRSAATGGTTRSIRPPARRCRSSCGTRVEFIGSDPDLQFNKVVADASWYWALPRNSVLVARLRGGFVFGQRIALGTDTTVFIPQQERLYAGGANTVRGFRQNELGPVVYLPDTLEVCIAPTGRMRRTDRRRWTRCISRQTRRRSHHAMLPVGGNTVAVANVELRMPSPFIPERVAGRVLRGRGSGVDARRHRRRAVVRQPARTRPGSECGWRRPSGQSVWTSGSTRTTGRPGAAYFDAPAAGRRRRRCTA